ncbi:UDP-glucuronate 4-epimerase [Salegentibacter holothuriorum]|uniref:UDP-glucuronate 4-epimerase n=1 Tax=Salegentibacter holothuriorum TaxID=241145 RepID=A0A1T5AQ52_9FLAO|nr:NAD-dependent epimerase [Salegentibacter holothuriorum]SKB37056.1 UDP-glucuronate 4-epimerase [Salegentibacter holothuriorum]
MRILVTGAAGFIGFHLSKKLVELGHAVVGVDNINDYYDTQLKYDRLNELGISQKNGIDFNELCNSEKFENFEFIRLNLEDRENLPKFFDYYQFEKVINLAAQAGVRYSIENPEAYIDSNLVGFANLLECCRNYNVKHLIYASSSSVYGQNEKVPFSVNDNVDHPISLYAATKKSNELMAYTYSHLYDFKCTGLRFFTVYGPWGRPDMAMFLFTDAIINENPIKVFNNGNQERDFTYIDDIVAGVVKIVDAKNNKGYSLYNIGNSKPVRLMDFIEEIEEQLGTEAEKKMLPMQAGDVSRTWADVESLKQDFDYSPHISMKDGVKKFISWYKKYYL